MTEPGTGGSEESAPTRTVRPTSIATGNLFKEGLVGGKLQIGLWLALGDAYAAEVCATCGFDWLLVDGEHGPIDLRTTLHCLQAVAAYPSQPVVRLPSDDPDLIKQVMELGAATLLIPMIENAEQASHAAKAMRYPPLGTRGVGSGLARSSRWRARADYLREADDEACLLVQVETRSALHRLEEISGVEGVDGIFIGPADLAASMGLLGRTDDPQVHDLVLAAIERVVGLGKPVGILSGDETQAKAYITAGATFVAVGADTTLLAQSARSLARRFTSSSTGVTA